MNECLSILHEIVCVPSNMLLAHFCVVWSTWLGSHGLIYYWAGLARAGLGELAHLIPCIISFVCLNQDHLIR